MINILRTTVIIDYQNVHLTSARLFEPGKQLHESLIHPLQFAEELIRKRNSIQGDGFELAQLEKVLVYRGLPSPEFDAKSNARNLAQKAHWELDRRVQVTLRSLRYPYKYDENGITLRDSAGKPLRDKPQEKGIDVLCALALTREARNAEVDLVIIASQDTDLVPALDEALNEHTAKIETCWWFDPSTKKSQPIRPTQPSRIWTTKLEKSEFSASVDQNTY